MLAVISTDLTTKLPEEDNSLFIDHVAHAGYVILTYSPMLYSIDIPTHYMHYADTI